MLCFDELSVGLSGSAGTGLGDDGVGGGDGSARLLGSGRGRVVPSLSPGLEFFAGATFVSTTGSSPGLGAPGSSGGAGAAVPPGLGADDTGARSALPPNSPASGASSLAFSSVRGGSCCTPKVRAEVMRMFQPATRAATCSRGSRASPELSAAASRSASAPAAAGSPKAAVLSTRSPASERTRTTCPLCSSSITNPSAAVTIVSSASSSWSGPAGYAAPVLGWTVAAPTTATTTAARSPSDTPAGRPAAGSLGAVATASQAAAASITLAAKDHPANLVETRIMTPVRNSRGGSKVYHGTHPAMARLRAPASPLRASAAHKAVAATRAQASGPSAKKLAPSGRGPVVKRPSL